MTQHSSGPTIRTEADIIASALHTLGYLPSNSLIFLTSGPQGLGPLIRLDLCPLNPQAISSYTQILHHNTPTETSAAGPLDRVFILFFSPRPQPTPSLLTPPPQDQHLQADADFAASLNPHILPLLAQLNTTPFLVADIIAIGTHTYWSLDTAQPTLNHCGPFNDIITSPLYTHLISQGSTVSTSHQEAHHTTSPNPLATTDPSQRDHWLLTAELAHNHHLTQRPPATPTTLLQDLTHWEQALTHTLPTAALTDPTDPHQPTTADQIRKALNPHHAGHLAATLDNTAILQLLLYQAATSHPQAQKALHHLHTNPNPDPTQPGPLNHLAQTLTGSTPTPPNWNRLNTLEHISNHLENISHTTTENNAAALQAWIHWLRGSTTTAHHILHHTTNPQATILHHLINSNTLPHWHTHPTT